MKRFRFHEIGLDAKTITMRCRWTAEIVAEANNLATTTETLAQCRWSAVPLE
jgi:hypothetical protein